MKKLPVILLLIALVGFVTGLVQLFHLRFETGDNYPPYSSLRADPLGTMALYESFEPLIETRRHLRSLNQLPEGRDTTLLWLGEDPMGFRFEPEQFQKLETFVRSGGRLIVSFVPSQTAPRINRFAGNAAARRARLGTNAPPVRPGEELADLDTISFRDRWEIETGYERLDSLDDRVVPENATLRRTEIADALPHGLQVHTAVYFTSTNRGWETIYARVSRTNVFPVVVERRLGRGSIVLSADSYHFSNEALRRDRETRLISWLVGPSRHVVFDETHLGVSREPGVASLIRDYRLGGVFVAFLILAGLFIWRNSASFMPPYAEQLAREQAETVDGRDSTSAFINLLKRNIAPADLMKVCIEQWNAHVSRTRRPAPERLEAMQHRIDAENQRPPAQRNPAQMYRDFFHILKRRT